MLFNVPLNQTIKRFRFDVLLTTYESMGIKMSDKGCFIKSIDHPHYFIMDPMALFSDDDVWLFTLQNNIPIHPLYYKGYRYIDNIERVNSTDGKPVFEKHLEANKLKSDSDLVKDDIQERLRMMGYL